MTTELAIAAAVSEYELAQRNRLATEAHLRATGMSSTPSGLTTLLEAERRAEREAARAMQRSVAAHPAWPWMERVRGIGPTLAARLLARLRIDKAPTPSSFWSYCGLATVPGVRYTCATCGVVILLGAHHTPLRSHRTSTGAPCTGHLQVDDESPARVAPRQPGRGQRRTFDTEARTVCHLIGVSFIRRGRAYRAVYDVRRERLHAERPDWTPNHVHLAAMRVTEKLFLAHLWQVWAGALGRPAQLPFAVARNGRAGVEISPWEMVES